MHVILLVSNCTELQRQHFFWENPYFFCDGDIKDCRPLWNGGTCKNCTSSNNPPWFYRQLKNCTTDDIEMRVCRDEPARNENVAIQAFDIYIQH